MGESIFTRAANDCYIPSEHARGPWDPDALHGGATAALIVREFERMQPGSELAIGRLSFEFFKPIRFEPLALSTEIVREGRRVQVLGAELRAGSDLICKAGALRIQDVPGGLPSHGPPPAASMPGPEEGTVQSFALNDSTAASLATTGVEMSWISDPWTLGPGRVWMRPLLNFLPDDPATPLMRLAGAADFGNGIAAELPFEEYFFINADLTIHMWRRPVGEWIGLDARTVLLENGIGTAESVLHDLDGPVAQASQTLVVQPR